jgi:hypothetical protein
MKTRTLLLLALGCAVAILLAGGVLLVQLVNRSEVLEPSPVGRPVEVGDMTVTVGSSAEVDGELTVEVRIGGVDDPDGADDFRLIASARPARLLESCGATTVDVRSCELRFEVPDDGGSRQLFYDRGDDGARWVLDASPS